MLLFNASAFSPARKKQAVASRSSFLLRLSETSQAGTNGANVVKLVGSSLILKKILFLVCSNTHRKRCPQWMLDRKGAARKCSDCAIYAPDCVASRMPTARDELEDNALCLLFACELPTSTTSTISVRLLSTRLLYAVTAMYPSSSAFPA